MKIAGAVNLIPGSLQILLALLLGSDTVRYLSTNWNNNSDLYDQRQYRWLLVENSSYLALAIVFLFILAASNLYIGRQSFAKKGLRYRIPSIVLTAVSIFIAPPIIIELFLKFAPLPNL